MKTRIVKMTEGVTKVTDTGVMRELLLRPENVGIESCEMGVLTLNPRQEWGYPDHHHTDEEAYFVLEGKGIQIIDDKEYEIGKYMAIYMPPNSIHITRNTGDEKLLVLYVRTPEQYR